MTLTISPEKEAVYQALAQAQGLSVEQWLTQLVEQAAPAPPSKFLSFFAGDRWLRERAIATVKGLA